MPSLKETALEHIEEDPFLAEAVLRGIVNAADMARWLKEHRDIEADTEALAQPIREIQANARDSSLESADALLKKGHIATHPNLTLLIIKRDDRIEQKLSRLVSELALRDEELMVTTRRNTLRIVLDKENATQAADLFDTVLVEPARPNLTEIQLLLDDSEDTTAVLGVALQALAAIGVNIVDIATGDTIHSILIDDKDRHKAWPLFHDEELAE